VVEQNLVLEISETTLSPLPNIQSKSSNSNRVREDAILRQLVELQNKFKQKDTEATRWKIRWRKHETG
jgi:hypothetical protein